MPENQYTIKDRMIYQKNRVRRDDEQKKLKLGKETRKKKMQRKENRGENEKMKTKERKKEREKKRKRQ